MTLWLRYLKIKNAMISGFQFPPHQISQPLHPNVAVIKLHVPRKGDLRLLSII
jgi:hypothetical protein